MNYISDCIFEHRVNGETLATFKLLKDPRKNGLYQLEIIKGNNQDYSVVNPNSDTPVASLKGAYLLLWIESYLVIYQDMVLIKIKPAKLFDFDVDKNVEIIEEE